MSSTVTRFAPSPTGRLHLGNARTALFSWLLARRLGGRFRLRIEDTDAARAVPGAEAALLEDLRWLGLGWDGEVVHQSARAARHAELLAALEVAGRAYPCFCTETELAVARRTALAAGRAPRYAGTCARLGPDVAAGRRARGESAALRLRMDGGGSTRFDDLVHGPHQELDETIGDFVIRRADGVPTFLFANAVDDVEMGVTHVLRGDDHLSNTPRQLALTTELQLLKQLRPYGPAYGHLPLVLGADGKPLAKRDGHATVAELRDAGYLATAVTNHLARLGHSGHPEALLSLEALAQGFELAHLGRAPARFDLSQLDHWQRLAVAALDEGRFAEWAGLASTPVPRAAHAGFIAAVRGNCLLPRDAAEWAERLFGEALPTGEAREAIGSAGPGFFAAAGAALAAHGTDHRAFAAALATATACKGRALHGPVRAALTGRLDGPELALLFPLLGAERLAARFARHA
jgi:glutamyl-tRNA synthetase